VTAASCVSTVFQLFVVGKEHAAEQIPADERADEAVPLRRRAAKGRNSRRRGPQQLNTILLAVLARWAVAELESEVEARGPDAVESDAST
jgi:hypothetical protein